MKSNSISQNILVNLSGLFFLVALISCSTTPTTFQTLVGGHDADRGIYVNTVKDGGFIAVGATRSFGQGNEDVLLVRLDHKGDTLWTRTFGGAGSDNGWAVQETSDGFIITGFTNDTEGGDQDCLIISTDRSGLQSWSTTFGGTGDEYCWSIAVAFDGTYIISGETTSESNGEEDCLLAKFDQVGKEIWSTTIGGALGDRCFSVVGAADGGFFLAGQTFSEGAGGRDAYLVKTDGAGNVEWSRTYGGSASDVGHSVSLTDTGDAFVAGYTSSFSVDGDDPYVHLVDTHGNLVWTKIISVEGINRSLTGEQLAGGGYILGGYTAPDDDGHNHALLIKLDASGEMVWSRPVFPTTTGRSVGYTVKGVSNGGAVLTGHTSEGSSGDLDLFVVTSKP